MIFCVSALAQARSVGQDPDSLEHTLGEVVVTSTVAPRTAVSTAPMRMATRELLQRSGVTDVSEALHRMPGVNLRDYGGAGGLKTVSVRGFGAGHTGVFYDGVPLSDVQSGQIDLSRYSIDNVGSIGMVIGDNDDIFIPARLAASAATVSISTMPVMDQRELVVKMRAGSFGYYNPFVRVGMPVSESSAINFVDEYAHADNDYPFTLRNGTLVTRERRTNSRMNSGHGELNWAWLINERNTLQTKAYYYGSRRQLPGPVIYYNDVSHERLAEDNAMAQAQWRSSLAPRLSLSAVAKVNYATSKYHDEDGKYPGGVLDQNYWQREYYGSAALLFTATDHLLFDYSADYFYNNLNSNLVTDRRPYRHSVLQSATAKYKTRRLTVMARLLASVYINGTRRGEAARDAKRLSPSVSVSYQPVGSQLLFVRASYKNIFRMPTFNEAYFDHYGSANVLPESTNQVNVGLTYTLRPSRAGVQATVALDAYVNNVRDMIVAVPYNMFVWSMTNLGKARTYGVDATADVTVTPGRGHDITLTANYSLQRAMPLTDPASSEYKKQVAYIPRHSGSASVSYEGPWVNLTVSGTGVSARYTTNNNLPATRIAGYVEFGASAWRSFALRGHTLEVRADVLNLLDKQYSVVARYPMPGRQYKLTLTYTY